MAQYWKGQNGGWHLVVTPGSPAETDPWGYPGSNDTIVPGTGGSAAGTNPAQTPASWVQDSKGNWIGSDPNAPSWAQGKAGSGLPSSTSGGTGGASATNVINQGDYLMRKLDIDNTNAIADRQVRIQALQQEMTLAQQRLAMESQQISSQSADNAAGRALQASEGAANRELQRYLADQQNKLNLLQTQLAAAQASGYIPSGLASALGIEAGPTLQTQQFAWGRFMDAMKMAENPREIVGTQFLQYGLQPDMNKPIPFLQALAEDKGMPEGNIGANMENISSHVRNWTANQLAAMPSLIRDEKVNPAAMTPVGGTSFLDQLRNGQLGPVPGQGQWPGLLDQLGQLQRNLGNLQQGFTFGS